MGGTVSSFVNPVLSVATGGLSNVVEAGINAAQGGKTTVGSLVNTAIAPPGSVTGGLVGAATPGAMNIMKPGATPTPGTNPQSPAVNDASLKAQLEQSVAMNAKKATATLLTSGMGVRNWDQFSSSPTLLGYAPAKQRTGA